MTALTPGQELVCAITIGLLLLIAICTLVVDHAPTSRRPPLPEVSRRRLLRELEHHPEDG